MNPEAPAILIKWPDALVWIEWDGDELNRCIQRLPAQCRLEVMDSNGRVFGVSHLVDGGIQTAYIRHDNDEIKTTLMALARGELRFDPHELKNAASPQGMFAAYANQLKAQQVGASDGDKPPN